MQEPSRKITLVGGEKVYPQKVLDTFYLANVHEPERFGIHVY